MIRISSNSILNPDMIASMQTREDGTSTANLVGGQIVAFTKEETDAVLSDLFLQGQAPLHQPAATTQAADHIPPQE
jgi:hypothetical protein